MARKPDLVDMVMEHVLARGFPKTPDEAYRLGLELSERFGGREYYARKPSRAELGNTTP